MHAYIDCANTVVFVADYYFSIRKTQNEAGPNLPPPLFIIVA